MAILNTINYYFPKANRLLRSADFRKVYEDGQRFHSDLFVFFVRKNSLPVTRLGITATRKIGTAVKRNRCKRLIREVFRLNQYKFPQGWDFVLNAKQPMINAQFATVETEFLKTVQKL